MLLYLCLVVAVGVDVDVGLGLDLVFAYLKVHGALFSLEDGSCTKGPCKKRGSLV